MRSVVSMGTMIHGPLTLRKFSVVGPFRPAPAGRQRSPQRSFARRIPKKSSALFRTSSTRL
jgi:hypothetical protein